MKPFPTEIIVTHANSDFDAFSSLFAAAKLYSKAAPILTGSLNRNVREFATLYLHDSDLVKAKDIDLQRVQRVIVVDTQYPSRLGVVGPLIKEEKIEKVVWDHHPRNEELEQVAPNSDLHLEEVGATVSLLLREIRDRHISISPMEATLFSLGIYEDTGSLLYRSTSELDFEILLWLKRQGADLRIVSSFLQRALTVGQRHLLDLLLEKMERCEVKGFSIATAYAFHESYVEDLDVVVNRIREIEVADAYFIAVTMKERTTYIVGRSKYEQVDVVRALAPFGGGGHLFAASASVQTKDAKEVIETIIDNLQRAIKPQLTAGDIMSHPVRTIHARTTVTGAQRLMLRFGYNGLPVIDDGKLVGIISRRETERAMRHGLGHAPVSGYMTRRVVTVGTTTPLLELQQLMVENNVSRLPVMETEKIVGVVTTNDILRFLYNTVQLPRIGYQFGEEEQEQPISIVHPEGRDLASLLRERFCDEGVEDFLRHLGERARDAGLKAYLVGGSVRDLLLGRKSKDLDVVLSGNAQVFARNLVENDSTCKSLTEFPKYKTAIVKLDNGWAVDIVTARREFYPGPASPPEVDTENVRIDLFRRDFTINAMAVALNPDEYGRLHDYYGGRRSLNRGEIRILHNLSFIEDPTRVFRALRFMARFGFELDEGTAHHLHQSLHDRALDYLTPNVLSRELERTLAEENILQILKGLDKHGVMRALGWPGVRPRIPVRVYKRAMRARRILKRIGTAKSKSSSRSQLFPILRYLLAPDSESRAYYKKRCQPSDRRLRDLELVDLEGGRIRRWLAAGAPSGEVDSLRKGVSQAVLVTVGGEVCNEPEEELRFIDALRL